MRAPAIPGLDESLRFAATFPGGRVAVVADDAAADALAKLARDVDRVAAPSDVASARGVVLREPTRLGPLIPQLQALAAAMRADARAVVSDVVWQTAPTPELARAFAPPPSGEKVRPIEGFEMQVEHAGLRILDKTTVARDGWLAFLAPGDPRRAALEGDERKACRVGVWLVAPS